jgi:5'-nucleotidase
MKILLTNDDGIYAKGLDALYRKLRHKHTVTVIAPDRERSAVGHAITLHEPIRVNRIEIRDSFSGYSISGTPADCVKLGILELMDAKPDMVISGINPGANVGINANYSGTVCAAREAGIYGIAAMAISINGNAKSRFDTAAHWIEKLAEKVFCFGLSRGTILSVNIPDVPLKKMAGVRISRQEILPFEAYFEKRVDPRNRVYYWQGGEKHIESSSPDVDVAAFSQNYITITPIKTDMTDYNAIDDLKKWNIEVGND